MKNYKKISIITSLCFSLLVTAISCIPSVKKETKEKQVAELRITQPETIKQDPPLVEKDTNTIELEEKVIPTEIPTKVFDVVEEMPNYPGGPGEMMKFIATNLKYPKETTESGLQGRVVVRFVVTETGIIENVEILRGIHSALDKEAIRVVKAMPKWEPGKQNGKPVAVYFTLPMMISPPKE